jgi:SagB-type dehydrogenase family enzyme
MKKILLLAFAMTIVATGAYAQKTKTVTNKRPNPAKITNPDGTQPSASAQAITVIELPPYEMGLDAPFREVLKNRRTERHILPEELPIEMVSSLLWSAYGINRPEESKRVVPSAINAQEFDIYLFNSEGIFLYNAEKNSIEMMVKGDNRDIISDQPFFKEAPISLVLVANYDRMERFKEADIRDFYAAVDCGYISQNIYLFCASAKLATVACGGINRDKLQKVLGLKNARPLLAHPVGMGK